jgi:hypothetical protein
MLEPVNMKKSKPVQVEKPIVFEKLKPVVQKVVLQQYEELLERERRCENNMREMERFLRILSRYEN